MEQTPCIDFERVFLFFPPSTIFNIKHARSETFRSWYSQKTPRWYVGRVFVHGNAFFFLQLPTAIKELVTDANFECNEEGIVLQAMDNSHVALVSVKFSAPAFKRYRCDRPMPLGVNLTSLTKVLRCAKDDDICTLKAADEADVLNLVYEAKSTSSLIRRAITFLTPPFRL